MWLAVDCVPLRQLGYVFNVCLLCNVMCFAVCILQITLDAFKDTFVIQNLLAVLVNGTYTY